MPRVHVGGVALRQLMLVVLFEQGGHHESKSLVGIRAACEHAYCRVSVLAAREDCISECAPVSVPHPHKLLPHFPSQDFREKRLALSPLEDWEANNIQRAFEMLPACCVRFKLFCLPPPFEIAEPAQKLFLRKLITILYEPQRSLNNLISIFALQRVLCPVQYHLLSCRPLDIAALVRVMFLKDLLHELD